MTISRNDPCPCGSGKKFKHCCLRKNIDWQASAPRRPMPFPTPRPRKSPSPGFAALGPFRIVDARLKEIAREAPGSGGWKDAIERLTETTSDEERIAVYKAIRDAGVLPDAAAFFLFGHAIQWMVSEVTDLDRHTLTSLRRFGLDDLAALYETDRLAYERRHERGRQFFHGPPDEMLAEHLRERGIID